MKERTAIFLYALVFSLAANGYVLFLGNFIALALCAAIILFVNLTPIVTHLKTKSIKLKACYHGVIALRIFRIATLLSVIYNIGIAFVLLPIKFWDLIINVIICIGVTAILFWNGIISVYLASVQLGIKQRVIGILCGMLPVVNLIVLNSIIKTVSREVDFETKKESVNLKRAEDKVCKTKYPILFVHGVFFRDTAFFNYWGRIPKELALNGAKIYYGNHQSAAPVSQSAEELAKRIKEIVNETGCEKVNIIAHSKGGLDCRYLLANTDAAHMVASLTTINTPHRGCIFADKLLSVVPEKVQNKVADTYNKTLKKLGDQNPDFMAAVKDLTASVCQDFDEKTTAPEGVFCRSVGSVLPKAKGGKFPLNLSYNLVKFFDGPNDGLVSVTAFKWGEEYTLLTPKGAEGISHGDMIDLNRHNIEGFDVREFYVGLVNDLKNRGL